MTNITTHKTQTRDWITTHKVLMNQEPQLHVHILYDGFAFTRHKTFNKCMSTLYIVFICNQCNGSTLQGAVALCTIYDMPFMTCHRITPLSSWISSTINAINIISKLYICQTISTPRSSPHSPAKPPWYVPPPPTLLLRTSNAMAPLFSALIKKLELLLNEAPPPLRLACWDG